MFKVGDRVKSKVVSGLKGRVIAVLPGVDTVGLFSLLIVYLDAECPAAYGRFSRIATVDRDVELEVPPNPEVTALKARVKELEDKLAKAKAAL